MIYFVLALGLGLAILDMSYYPKSIKENILRKCAFIILGIIVVYLLDKSYLQINYYSSAIGIAAGLVFMVMHIAIAKGIKLSSQSINIGLVKTSLLMYFIELPAEELLYRGVILISALQLFGPTLSIGLSSLVFLLLHVRTWNNRFVWFGSLFLAITCGVAVYVTKSIWTGILIHNLNDLGYMTLVNKRDIFTDRDLSV